MRLALRLLIAFCLGGLAAPAHAAVTPVFDLFPALAPPAYCGTIKMRAAYAGHSLRLALGNSTSTVQDFDWVTNARGVEVIDDAAVQTWLAANSNTFAWVITCYDQSGNGFNYTAHTVAVDSPYYKGNTTNNLPGAAATPAQAEWLGFASMTFSGLLNTTSVAQYLNMSGSVTSNQTAASFMASLFLNDTRPTGTVQISFALASLGAGSPGAGTFSFGQYQGVDIFSVGASVISTTLPAASDWSVKGFTAGTSNVCAYDDLASNCQVNTFGAAALTGGVVGGPANFALDGNVTTILGPWPSELTPTQYGQVRDGVKDQLNISTTPTTLVVWDGDSITEHSLDAYVESHSVRAVQKIYNDTGTRVRSYNVALGGACIATASCPIQLQSLFATKTAPILQSGAYAKRIYYLMAGTNDIAQGTAHATVSGYLITLIGTARAAQASVKVVYGGMISRIGSGIDANCFLFMQDVIAAASYDLLTGWYNDANMKCQSGGGTNYANTTYFAADGIHPINLGHNVGAGYDATALESLLPGPITVSGPGRMWLR